MAITFVGTTTDEDTTVALPTMLEGDICIVANCEDNSLVDLPTDWIDIYVSPDAAPAGRVFYKIMGSTPDTSVTLTGHSGGATVCQAFRGVDTNNPFDVTATTATSTSGMPNPPTIVPITDEAWVVIVGLLDDDNVTPTAPSGYTNFGEVGTSAPNSTTMMASKEIDPAASENPAAFGGSGTDSWDAVSIALRPVRVTVAARAAPTYVAGTTNNLQTTHTLPTSLEDDIVVVIAFNGAAQYPSLPSGWTQIGSTGTTPHSRAFYKRMGATPDTTFSQSPAMGSVCQAFRGVDWDEGTPVVIPGSQPTVNTTSMPIPPILTTPATGGTLFVMMGAVDNQAATGTAPDRITPDHWTQVLGQNVDAVEQSTNPCGGVMASAVCHHPDTAYEYDEFGTDVNNNTNGFGVGLVGKLYGTQSAGSDDTFMEVVRTSLRTSVGLQSITGSFTGVPKAVAITATYGSADGSSVSGGVMSYGFAAQGGAGYCCMCQDRTSVTTSYATYRNDQTAIIYIHTTSVNLDVKIDSWDEAGITLDVDTASGFGSRLTVTFFYGDNIIAVEAGDIEAGHAEPVEFGDFKPNLMMGVGTPGSTFNNSTTAGGTGYGLGFAAVNPSGAIEQGSVSFYSRHGVGTMEVESHAAENFLSRPGLSELRFNLDYFDMGYLKIADLDGSAVYDIMYLLFEMAPNVELGVDMFTGPTTTGERDDDIGFRPNGGIITAACLVDGTLPANNTSSVGSIAIGHTHGENHDTIVSSYQSVRSQDGVGTSSTYERTDAKHIGYIRYNSSALDVEADYVDITDLGVTLDWTTVYDSTLSWHVSLFIGGLGGTVGRGLLNSKNLNRVQLIG